MAGKIKKAKGAGNLPKGATVTTTPMVVSVAMTLSHAKLVEQLGAKVFVGSPDKGFKVADPNALRAALVVLGGENWAEQMMAEVDTALQDGLISGPPINGVFPI